jgi:hypothetical protein
MQKSVYMLNNVLLFPLPHARVLRCWLCFEATFALMVALDIRPSGTSHYGTVRRSHDHVEGIPRSWALFIVHGDARWGEGKAESIAGL